MYRLNENRERKYQPNGAHVFRSFHLFETETKHMVKYWLNGGVVSLFFFFISRNHHSHPNDFLTYHEMCEIYEFSVHFCSLIRTKPSNTINSPYLLHVAAVIDGIKSSKQTSNGTKWINLLTRMCLVKNFLVHRLIFNMRPWCCSVWKYANYDKEAAWIFDRIHWKIEAFSRRCMY